jgi:hypothetical protein
MRIIKPVDIDLKATNVAGSTYAEYASGTTYAKDDYVKVSFESDGTTPRQPVEEFQSVADSNTGNYPVNDVVNWLPLGSSNRWKMFDDYTNTLTENDDSIEIELDSSNCNSIGLFNVTAKQITLTQVVERELVSDPDLTSDFLTKGDGWAWDVGEKYTCDGTQTTVSTLTGAITTIDTLHYQVTFTIEDYVSGTVKGYIDGNVGDECSSNGTYVQVIAADGSGSFGIQASDDFIGSISYISAKKVPQHETVNLATAARAGWWYYFFTPITYKTTLLWDFSRYWNATIKVNIESLPGTKAKCGQCVIGAQTDIGDTESKPTISILDYSKKDTDTYGRTYLKKGPYAREGNINVVLRNTQIDAVDTALTDARGTAVIFDCNNAGKSDYESLVIYGFYDSFDVNNQGTLLSHCAISIKGLI